MPRERRSGVDLFLDRFDRGITNIRQTAELFQDKRHRDAVPGIQQQAQEAMQSSLPIQQLTGLEQQRRGLIDRVHKGEASPADLVTFDAEYQQAGIEAQKARMDILMGLQSEHAGNPHAEKLFKQAFEREQGNQQLLTKMGQAHMKLYDVFDEEHQRKQEETREVNTAISDLQTGRLDHSGNVVPIEGAEEVVGRLSDTGNREERERLLTEARAVRGRADLRSQADKERRTQRDRLVHAHAQRSNPSPYKRGKDRYSLLQDIEEQVTKEKGYSFHQFLGWQKRGRGITPEDQKAIQAEVSKRYQAETGEKAPGEVGASSRRPSVDQILENHGQEIVAFLTKRNGGREPTDGELREAATRLLRAGGR